MRYLILLFLLTSCDPRIFNSSSNNVPKYDTIPKKDDRRIKIKEMASIDGTPYRIIEIDSVEYIVSYHGGICPLVKK